MCFKVLSSNLDPTFDVTTDEVNLLSFFLFFNKLSFFLREHNTLTVIVLGFRGLILRCLHENQDADGGGDELPLLQDAIESSYCEHPQWRCVLQARMLTYAHVCSRMLTCADVC